MKARTTRSPRSSARHGCPRGALALGLLVALLGSACNSGTATEEVALTDFKLLIEHNSTDEDTGFQGFGDGEPWNELRFLDPAGMEIVHARALGGLLDFGLTEFFFETSEPENALVPIPDVLARLAVGDYSLTGEMVEGGTSSFTTPFTHVIPEGPVLTNPPDGATGLDPDAVVLEWEPVTENIDGGAVNIVGYQVILEKDVPQAFPQGFASTVLSVYLPPGATQVTVPQGFLEDDACYEWEVLAIEVSGNQTLSSAAFETGDGCEPVEDPESDEPVLDDAKILIEHNATDEDTGFQGFADGDPWDELTITGPGGEQILIVSTRGTFVGFGLTELFFETSEPANIEVPIPDVLARLPAGTYTFRGIMVGGAPSTMTATLSHAIPEGPELLSPADGATDVDPLDTVIAWDPVTTDINGAPVQIVGYQVIVEEDVEPAFPQGFAQAVFSIYLPATATSVRVPPEFMRADTDYAYEVLAIAVTGNQTLSSAGFATE